jgi:hypothetical protein
MAYFFGDFLWIKRSAFGRDYFISPQRCSLSLSLSLRLLFHWRRLHRQGPFSPTQLAASLWLPSQLLTKPRLCFFDFILFYFIFYFLYKAWFFLYIFVGLGLIWFVYIDTCIYQLYSCPINVYNLNKEKISCPVPFSTNKVTLCLWGLTLLLFLKFVNLINYPLLNVLLINLPLASVWGKSPLFSVEMLIIS